MFYFISFGILTLLALLELVITPKRTKKVLYVLLCIFFIAIGSLRWNTGNDWRPYYTFFTSFTTDNPYFLIAMEPGFVQLVKFLRVFSSNFTFYLTILSVLTIGLKALFFYEYAGAIFMAMLLYWGTNIGDVIAVRQSLAISICLISTHFIIYKKPIHFVVCVLLATQIHVTSYIYLLSYPIYYAEWSVRNKYSLLFISLVIGSLSFSQNLLELLIKITPNGVGLDRINEKALNYLELGNEVNYGNQLSKTERLAAAISKRAILLPILFYFQERVVVFKDKYKGFLNLYTFGNVVFFLVIDFLTLQRLASYFYIFEILLLCIVFANVRSKFVWFAIIVIYSMFKLISILVNASHLMVPYIWIFSDNTDRFVY